MYCVDTTFLIDFFKKKIVLDGNLTKILNEKVLITPITIFELFHGIYKLKRKVPTFNLKKREKEIKDLTKYFEIHDFDYKAAIKAAEILDYLEKRGEIVELNDIMIASIGIVNNFKIIITRNEKHFKKIPEIQIQSYSII